MQVTEMIGKQPGDAISYAEFRKLVCLMPGMKV